MISEPARQELDAAVHASTNDLANFVLRGGSLVDSLVLRFDLVSSLAQTVVNDVLDFAKSLTTKEFLNYDPSYQTSRSQVLVEQLDQIPELAAVDAHLRRGDVAPYDGDDRITAMAHEVGLTDHAIVVYRVKGPGIATRKKGLALLPRDDVYAPVRGEILYYEPRFDVLTCAGYAYFTKVSIIQRQLHAPEKARQLAKKTLAEVTKKIEISGFAELEQAVMDDPTMRAKLAQVARILNADPDYANHLTTDRLVDFIDKYPDYNISVTTTDGKRVLQFEASPQRRHQIPKLLADDYLHSHLTNRNYDSGSKQHV